MQQNFETTFDVDGNIETRSTSSQGNKDDTRSQRSITSSRDGNRYYYQFHLFIDHQEMQFTVHDLNIIIPYMFYNIFTLPLLISL